MKRRGSSWSQHAKHQCIASLIGGEIQELLFLEQTTVPITINNHLFVNWYERFWTEPLQNRMQEGDEVFTNDFLPNKPAFK
jgi:hypothetical protein